MAGGSAGITPGRISLRHLRHLRRTALGPLSKRLSYLHAFPLRRGKVREHSLAKFPVFLVVGRREADQQQVAVRQLGDSARPVLALGEYVSALAAESGQPGTAPSVAAGTG